MTFAFKLLSKEQLSEYDLIICLDKSGSMASPEKLPSGQTKTRWQLGEEFVLGFAHIADEVDDDGLTLITFGGTFNFDTDVKDGVRADKVHEAFKTQTPYGGTPMADALNAAAEKHFSSSKKTIVMVATDGVPSDPQAVEQVIIRSANKLNADGELTFLFVQIGSDAGAAKYLDSLDDDLQGKGAKYDIVDAINQKAAESMSFEQMLSKAIVD